MGYESMSGVVASGVSTSLSGPNVWQTRTFTSELRWGNDYMHARYYNLNLGRFLSVDPVGGSVGSSQSWNRYSYVLNSPIRFTDPFGLEEKDCCGGYIPGRRGRCFVPKTGPPPLLFCHQPNPSPPPHPPAALTANQHTPNRAQCQHAAVPESC
ncbi:MAG: RHS repeat-associated core domain-containing protein [bacterium]